VSFFFTAYAGKLTENSSFKKLSQKVISFAFI